MSIPLQLETDIKSYLTKQGDAKVADEAIKTAKANHSTIVATTEILYHAIISGADAIKAAKQAEYEAAVEAGENPEPLTGMSAPSFFYVDGNLLKVDSSDVEVFYGVEVHMKV